MGFIILLGQRLHLDEVAKLSNCYPAYQAYRSFPIDFNVQPDFGKWVLVLLCSSRARKV